MHQSSTTTLLHGAPTLHVHHMLMLMHMLTHMHMHMPCSPANELLCMCMVTSFPLEGVWTFTRACLPAFAGTALVSCECSRIQTHAIAQHAKLSQGQSCISSPWAHVCVGS